MRLVGSLWGRGWEINPIFTGTAGGTGCLSHSLWELCVRDG